jgi:hypothetical protein
MDTMEMENFVEEIRLQVPFKDETEIGDIILMLKENEKGKMIIAYAQVLNFTLDTTKRDEWWHVGLVFMDLPLVFKTFTLQKSHFTGQEIFTMGGKKVFIKAVNTASFLEENNNTDNQNQKELLEKKEKKIPPKPKFTLIH